LAATAPIVIQSMTNTDTEDVFATSMQVAQLARAGSELVRITVNTREAAAAVPKIRDRLAQMNVGVPLIGDFHFNGHKLLTEHPACAEALAKLRINPGNVGKGARRDEQFAQLIEIACKFEKPIRIGVNWGSLDQALLARIMDENAKRAEPKDATEIMREAMVTSALESAAQAEQLGLAGDRIILSCKVSGVQDLISIYRELAVRCDYPLHLGLTEAGMGSKGIVASTAALSILLQEGIGDTIRVSLTPEPNGDRTREVIVAQEILSDHGSARFHAAGGGVSRLRAYHQHGVPGAGAGHSELCARAHAGVAPGANRCRKHDPRRDGLRGERARGKQACEHRHFFARYRRSAGGSRVCRWRTRRHAARRQHRR